MEGVAAGGACAQGCRRVPPARPAHLRAPPTCAPRPAHLRAPAQVRELLLDFYHSRYASCLRHLEALRPQLQLDLHLAGHLEGLYSHIRQRALVQWVAALPCLCACMLCRQLGQHRCAHWRCLRHDAHCKSAAEARRTSATATTCATTTTHNHTQ